MIQLLFLGISFISSVIGGICGIGGGVIIKPVLDATGVLSVSSVSFLSGCTVLSMALVSFIKNRISSSQKLIEMKLGTALATGAVLGGMVGKILFNTLKDLFQNENYIGAVQAGLLIMLTLMTLVYTVSAHKITTHHIKNKFFCSLMGFILGIVSAFLGIGGGPINLMVLSFFFSMNTKKAAANSLYIILLSQLASLTQTLITHTVPIVSPTSLGLMAIGGVTGGLLGNKIGKVICSKQITALFIYFMIVIIFINVFNIIKFIVT
jgi:uncharacterized protein